MATIKKGIWENDTKIKDVVIDTKVSERFRIFGRIFANLSSDQKNFPDWRRQSK